MANLPLSVHLHSDSALIIEPPLEGDVKEHAPIVNMIIIVRTGLDPQLRSMSRLA